MKTTKLVVLCLSLGLCLSASTVHATNSREDLLNQKEKLIDRYLRLSQEYVDLSRAVNLQDDIAYHDDLSKLQAVKARLADTQSRIDELSDELGED